MNKEDTPLYKAVPVNFHEDLDIALEKCRKMNRFEIGVWQFEKTGELQNAFPWSESPQGFDFWFQVATREVV